MLIPYLAATFVLLAVVFTLSPHQAAGPGAPAAGEWDYQREVVAIQGGGVGNAYARTAIRATAWMTKGSIERQRDVFRLNLVGYLAGQRLAGGVGAWREAHRLPLEGGTMIVLVALIAYGVLGRPAGRAWMVAVLLLVALTLAVTRPVTVERLASAPTIAVPDLVTRVTASARSDPGRGPDTGEVRERLAARYWTLFVAYPLSRLQTGSPVLAESPPTAKAGILELLRRRIAGVNDWAVGRHGAERAIVATTATVYVLPFALALGALAMVATCAQTLLYLLCLAGLVVVPLALDARRRRAVVTWWMLPLAGSVVVLVASTMLSLLVLWLGQTVHAADEELGLLLAGSIGPVLATGLTGRWLRRSRRARRLATVGGASS
ncbi:MAG TPA: hypothetical protein VG276_05540 [Actinomycetes bacterium]|nr:hypothetical protein [Actinomycetes bacterium]